MYSLLSTRISKFANELSRFYSFFLCVCFKFKILIRFYPGPKTPIFFLSRVSLSCCYYQYSNVACQWICWESEANCRQQRFLACPCPLSGTKRRRRRWKKRKGKIRVRWIVVYWRVFLLHFEPRSILSIPYRTFNLTKVFVIYHR